MTDGWLALCQRLVPETLRQRDWRLISEDRLPAFIERVCQTIVEGTVRPRPGASAEATVRRATIHCYCYELYRASGENGTLRQRRAFEEIGQHAQGVAFYFEQNPTVVQSCVQNTLQIVWEKRNQVREPGSFLRYIEQVVHHEIKGYWKDKHHRHEVPMSQIMPAGRDDENEELLQRFWETLASVPPPDDEVAGRQLSEQLWAEVRRVLADNPRYQAVIIGYYFYELSLPALAEMLHTSVRNIYVLKSRALDRLRADEEFIRRFADALESLPGGKS